MKMCVAELLGRGLKSKFSTYLMNSNFSDILLQFLSHRPISSGRNISITQ